MKYDLIANFYYDKESQDPDYRLGLNVITTTNLHAMTDIGFKEIELCDGYTDYTMDIEEEDLHKWIAADFCTDELTYVFQKGPYERIELTAYELDILDDDGTIPARGLMIGNVSVTIKGNSPESKVVFADSKHRFTLKLKRLYDVAGVHTVFDVIDYMYRFRSGDTWTLQALKEYFRTDNDKR